MSANQRDRDAWEQEQMKAEERRKAKRRKRAAEARWLAALARRSGLTY
jgi:hypothetical protein